MIIGHLRFASTSVEPVDDYTYGFNSVRKIDYEKFLFTSSLLSVLLQRLAMALRILNIDLSLIRDRVLNSEIGKKRLEFRCETIDYIYASVNNDLPRKINHRVVRELKLNVQIQSTIQIMVSTFN